MSRSPQEKDDRDWIVARRALFVSTALGALHACSSPATPDGTPPTDTAGASDTGTGSNEPTDPTSDLDARLDELEKATTPECSILDSVCAPKWRALAGRFKQLRKDVLQGAKEGQDGRVEPDVEREERLVRVRERIEDGLAKEPEAEASLTAWRNMVDPQPVIEPPPMPCLSPMPANR